MRARIWASFCFVTTLIFVCSQVAEAEEAGFVQSVHGKVSRKVADGSTHLLRNFDSVQVSDIIVADHNGSVEVISFANGKHVKLGPSGTYRVLKQGFKTIAGSITTLKPIDKRFLRAVRGSSAGGLAGVTTRGGDESDLFPNQSIRNETPKLTWPKITNPRFVSLTLTEGSNVILDKDLPSAVSSFSLDGKVVRRGHRYGWSITAMDGSGLDVSYTAAFYVLTRDEDESLRSLESAERHDNTLRGPLIVAYQRLGLNQEAQSLLDK